GGYVVVITGTVAQVNAALNTLKFSPDANFNDIHALVTGPARIDAVVSDLGNSGPAPSLPLTALESVTISVTPVNDAPLIVAPTDVNAVEDTTKPFVGLDGIFIDDPDANELGFTNPQLTVTLHVTHGVLNVGVIPLGNPLDPLDDTTVSGLGTSTLVISGLRDYVNASLASLTYTPEANFNDNVAVVTGPAVLSIDVSDNGNVGLGGAQHAYGSIVIHVEAVNDAPTITAPATATTNEDATVSIPGVSVADVDADEAGHLAPQMTVTLTAEHGTVKLLSLAGLTIDAGANDSATIAISGTISAINSALASLQFHPDADFNDNRGAARIHIDAQDNGNTGVGPLSGWSATRQTIDVSVAAVNDAPTIVVPAAQITNEDTPIVFSAGAGTQIVVGDVDAFESGATDQVVVTLTAVNGVLNLAAIGSLLVTGDGTGVVTLTGTLADVALALDGLTFSPTLHLSGAAQITVAVDDLGNTGLGGAKSDLKTIPITIIAVADDPTLSVATPIAGVEGTWIA
ncbi:MAG TPA: hypothetical protein VGF99_05495, partial [Myxococcota bacterium]